MQIVMHCMGMPFNGTTIEHSSLGGSESAAYYVAKELAKNHSVTLFTMSQDEGIWDGVKYVYCGERSEQHPLGDRFHFYATSTPHDVCIIQRSPVAFRFKWASKINLWWVHDLALHRTAGLVNDMMWNVDGVLCVSQYHIDQLTGVYDIDPAICHNIQNGVDLSLFEPHARKPEKPYRLLYTSRPERGLESLVEEGGIMDELGTDYELGVCCYQNVTAEMEPYYRYLYQRIDDLPNAKNFGYLDKKALAKTMSECDLQVYPTTFEEVSCITAMETMASGLPLVTSSFAALPETCADSGSVLIPINGDYDDPSIEQSRFVEQIKKICENPTRWNALSESQLKAAKLKTWSDVAGRVLNIIADCFSGQSESSIAKRLLANSDIYALSFSDDPDPLLDHIKQDVNHCYAFTNDDVWDDHYKRYYEYEKARGVDYGPEQMEGDTRFETVSAGIDSLPGGAVVLDYGCAHGHYTISLAKRFPEKTFIGIDITQTNVDKARQWAKDEGLENVSFEVGEYKNGFPLQTNTLDLIIAAEVLGHMADPWDCTDKLESYLSDTGKMVITVPFGPWEAIGYREHYPWRAHVHHFEREDLSDVWGSKTDYQCRVIPHGPEKTGDLLGSHIVTYTKGGATGRINYARKLKQTVGKPTIALCMIVKDAEESLARCLNSVIDYVDEIIINVDEHTQDTTSDIISRFESQNPMIRFDVREGKPATEIGFDQARNDVIERANADWILWLDDDEIIHNPQSMIPYLRNNQYNGYAIPQHHMSIEPMGVLKTDLPVKIFRNNKGIQFFGCVHEHPERAMNKGVGRVITLPNVSIVHDGYPDESVRRARFARNIGLMMKDRKENPDRVLGKMLWVRDLAQSIKFDIERGRQLSQDMVHRAKEGVGLWRELLNDNLRMAVDSLDYYSSLVTVLNPKTAIDYKFGVSVKSASGGIQDDIQTYSGTFESLDDAKMFRNAVESAKTKGLYSRYK